MPREPPRLQGGQLLQAEPPPPLLLLLEAAAPVLQSLQQGLHQGRGKAAALLQQGRGPGVALVDLQQQPGLARRRRQVGRR